ncbi:MAG: Gfo/Idh/MocA family oxidoreductase [Verrucomicrobia bacterium]|nr:Gfo/Idh/MocA family oxidoreductase [Verrucomicrobiota bacterium]
MNTPVFGRPAVSRRQFLHAGAVAAAAPFLLPSGLRAAGPSHKLAHACIGVTRMGHNDLKNFQEHARLEIVALCDVDRSHLETAAKQVPGARLYSDWREMFAQEGDRIDSVNVTVPDHMHYPIAAEALRRGKHLYCQKPMCHDLAEVRRLTTAAAAKPGLVTQLGTQFAASIGDRMTVHYLRAGAIGKVKHVYLCSSRPAPNRLGGPRPAQTGTPPPALNWDHWLGTAPARPFAPDTYHPAKWRAWLDFGTSWCADMGCHIFDATWRALELRAPTRVVAEVESAWKNSPERRAQNWPQSEHITWTFPGNARTEGRELVVEWFDGPDFLPPKEVRDLNPSGKYPQESAMILGTEGALLHTHGAGPRLLPVEKFRNYPRPTPPARNHYHHYVDACLGGERTESHFAHSGPLTEAILLGSIAIRCPDQALSWDAAAMRFPNFPEAERFLRRQYRAGWEVA